MRIGLSSGETGPSLFSVADEVLEPPEQFRVSVQKRGGELDQLGPADHLLVEEDQAAEEVVVHFRTSQSLPDFVEEGKLVEAAELSGLGESDVSKAVGFLLFRRRVADSAGRSLDAGRSIGSGGDGNCGGDAAAALADALLAARHARAKFCGPELKAADGGRIFLGQAAIDGQS